MAKASQDQVVTVEGRTIKLTNLDKVLYPKTQTTKADVLSYYAQVGPTMLPHLRDRPATRKRWPDGVVGPRKNHRLSSSTRISLLAPLIGCTARTISHREHDNDYPVINDLATLTWLAQLAALEIHVPQWRFGPDGEPQNPDRLVLDLDPGPGVDLATCAGIAQLVRDILRDIGHDPVPVTSGSKGIHLYAPLDGSQTTEEATHVARELALALEADHPDVVISTMKRSQRDGKVFIDWSQNNGAKTTVSPYSLRGREQPWVAAPRTWEELADPNLQQLEYEDVLARLADLGDTLAPLAPFTDRDRLATYGACAMRPRRGAVPAGRQISEPMATDSSSRNIMRDACTTTSDWNATACSQAGRCPRHRPAILASTISQCALKIIRWSTSPSTAVFRRVSTALGVCASGTPGPIGCTSGVTARR
jgi:bifunctional non-homologous end joining protein LigD